MADVGRRCVGDCSAARTGSRDTFYTAPTAIRAIRRAARLLPGLTLGGGVRYQSDSYATQYNGRVTPSHTTADLAIRYQTDQYALDLGVTNLFDKNQHPIYIALDESPYIMSPSSSNGDLGTSMAGRSFFAGMTLAF